MHCCKTNICNNKELYCGSSCYNYSLDTLQTKTNRKARILPKHLKHNIETMTNVFWCR